MMKKNEFHTWMVLLDNPNKWLDVMEMAFLTNLTRRQMSSILSAHINDKNLEKEYDKDCRMMIVRLNGSKPDLDILRRSIFAEYYGITEDMKAQTSEYLPLAGWITIPDLARDSGLDRTIIAHTLVAMENVDIKRTNSGTYYRRNH